MERESTEEFYKQMERESTAVLRRIWHTEYRNEWTEDQFAIVGQILQERGEDLSAHPPEEADIPMQSLGATEVASTYVASRYAASSYAALRGLASLCTALGWLILVLAGLGAISGLATMGRAGFALGSAIVFTSVAIGGFFFIVLRVIAEGISVLLDIEANTRQAAIHTQRTVAILERSSETEEAA